MWLVVPCKKLVQMGLLIYRKMFSLICENIMCEFNVILDGQKVFSDVIYVKVESNNVTVKNIIGEAREYKNVKITEVDVTTTRLVLETIKV